MSGRSHLAFRSQVPNIVSRTSRRRFHERFGLFVLAIYSCAPLLASADESQSSTLPKIVNLQAGFAGYFKVGSWAPVEITLQGGQKAWRGQVDLIALDGDAVPTRERAPAEGSVELNPGESKTVPLYLRVGQLKSDVTVNLRNDNGLADSKRFAAGEHEALAGIIPSSQELIVLLGAPSAADDPWQLSADQTKVARVEKLSDLPADWWGYEGVDVVVLTTGQLETIDQARAEGQRIAALDRWVQMGGRLVLGVGQHAPQVLAADSPLVKLVPGTLESMVPLRQSTMFESYADTSEPLPGLGGPLELHVPKLRDVRGKIEVYAGNHPRDLPLVVRAPHGFGELVLVAVDLDRPPFSNWAGRTQFFNKLLRRSDAMPSDTGGGTLGQVTTLGFTDLLGQMRGALDQFAGVQLVPFWLVAVLVLAYIVCIGPLDYFIVKRVLGQMEATWLTFGLTVLLFSGGAYWLAYELKGRELRVNQVDLVDFDAESKLVRGTSWSNVFSPAIEAYNLSLRPAALADFKAAAPELIFAWLGLPGNGFGGMNPRSGSLPQFTEPYDYSPRLNRLDRVPIAIWSSKALVGRWWTHAAGEIEAHLSDQGKLTGTLANHATQPLEHCVLVYDRWAFPIKRLEPGRQIDVETGLDPQTIETYLRHVTMQGERDLSKPYDRASFDVPRIVEMMSLHGLAGGEKYTGLSFEYQGFVELSQLVRDGRAVLIGRRAEPAATLTRDGEPLDQAPGEHWTYYRYVFPVAGSAGP